MTATATPSAPAPSAPALGTAALAGGRTRRVLALAGVTLLRLARDRVALFFAFLLPLLIIALIGTAISDDDLPVGVVAPATGGPLAGDLRSALEQAGGLRVRRYDDLDSLRLGVRRREVAGGLVVPASYDDDLQAGRAATVSLVLDPTSEDSTAARTRLAAVVAEQGGVVGAARFAATRTGTDFGAALGSARDLAGRGGGPRVASRTVGTEGLGSIDAFAYSTYGELVLFMFLTALTGAGELVESRRLGVTRRALSTPTSATTVLLGEGVGHYSVTAIQALVIVTVGGLLFGVSWGAPAGAFAIILCFGLVATGAGLFAGTIARTPEQASTLAPFIGIALAMLGGCTWPLEITPPVMQRVAHLTPHAWAMDAWIAHAGEGASLAEIAPELGILLAFAASFLALGVWRLRRAMLR